MPVLSLRGWVKPNQGAPTLKIALAPPALRTYCVAVAPLAFRVDAPGVETRVRWRFLLRVQLEARLLPSAVSAEPASSHVFLFRPADSRGSSHADYKP